MNNYLMAVGCMLAMSVPAQAFEDLGPLEQARESYPQLFIPQSVNQTEIAGRPHYVFSGQAERYFDDEMDSELWEEATLSAKAVLFEHFAEGNKATKVDMSGCAPLYRVKEGKTYTMLMAVPVARVKVSRPIAPKPVPAANPAPASVPVFTPAPVPVATTAPQPSSDPTPVPETAPVIPPVASEANNEIGVLRDDVASHPNDWRKRRRLAELYFQTGKSDRALRHLALAVKGALEEGTNGDELYDLLVSSARKFEAAGNDALSLKCSRILLHKPVPFELKKEANARIARLRLRMD